MQGVALIVETQSENPRGNIPDVKKILNRAAYVIGKEGSAAWLFDRRGTPHVWWVIDVTSTGVLSIGEPADESVDPELLAIDVGADELRPNPDDDDSIQARTPHCIVTSSHPHRCSCCARARICMR